MITHVTPANQTRRPMNACRRSISFFGIPIRILLRALLASFLGGPSQVVPARPAMNDVGHGRVHPGKRQPAPAANAAGFRANADQFLIVAP